MAFKYIKILQVLTDTECQERVPLHRKGPTICIDGKGSTGVCDGNF